MKQMILVASLLAVSPAMAQNSAAPSPSSVAVQNAWARATTRNAQSGGIFLTLTDKGAPDRLVGVTTPVAAMAQLHQSVNDNGVMKMDAVPALDLPPGKPVELKPGGYHIMLMGLKQQLKPGDTFPVTLNFAKAPQVTATVTVGKAGAS
ncbi:MAG TPA: copper chaperone PCu(A)C, partial [Acetobacteraceae bacterium]